MFRYLLFLVLVYLSHGTSAASVNSTLASIATKTSPIEKIQGIVPCLKTEVITMGTSVSNALQKDPVSAIETALCGNDTLNKLVKSLNHFWTKIQTCNGDYKCYLPIVPIVAAEVVATFLHCAAEFDRNGPKAMVISAATNVVTKCVVKPFA